VFHISPFLYIYYPYIVIVSKFSIDVKSQKYSLIKKIAGVIKTTPAKENIWGKYKKNREGF